MNQQICLGRDLQHPIDIAVADRQRLERWPTAPGGIRPAPPPQLSIRAFRAIVSSHGAAEPTIVGGLSARAMSDAANVSAIRSIATSGSRVRLNKNASTSSWRRS